jgi:hypothetical protein
MFRHLAPERGDHLVVERRVERLRAVVQHVRDAERLVPLGDPDPRGAAREMTRNDRAAPAVRDAEQDPVDVVEEAPPVAGRAAALEPEELRGRMLS